MGTLSSPTLQNVITVVRGMLNQPSPTNSFWKDTELTDYINEGVRMYFSEVTQNNEGYFTTQVDLDIVADTATVALPSDFYQIKILYKKVTNGYLPLSYRNNLTEGYSTQGGSSSNGFLPDYYFQGNSIVLRPTPNFSEVGGLRLEYIQFPDTLINGGDAMTSQVSPVFKQLVEAYAVYKAKLKESLVSGVAVHTAAEGHLGAVVKMLRDSIAMRSKNPTSVIPFNPEG